MLPWQTQVLNSDSADSPPEDDPDSVVVEYVDFIKVKPVSSSTQRVDNTFMMGWKFGFGLIRFNHSDSSL